MATGVESFFTDWEVTLVVLAIFAGTVFIAWVLIKYGLESMIRIWEAGPKHGHFPASYGCPVCDMWLERLLHRGPLPITKTREAELRRIRDEARAQLQAHWETFHGRPKEGS